MFLRGLFYSCDPVLPFLFLVLLVLPFIALAVLLVLVLPLLHLNKTVQNNTRKAEQMNIYPNMEIRPIFSIRSGKISFSK